MRPLLFYIKLKNIIKFPLYLLIQYILKLRKIPINPNTLLLIRLDSIGDYVLLRNFIRLLRKDDNYKDHKITLCGNIIWKDLAVNFDKDIIDEFIWVDRNKFSSNLSYRYKLLKSVNDGGYETTIDLTYSRESLFGDMIVRASFSKERIGSHGAPDKYAKWKRNLITDKYYTKLIPAAAENIFEFYRNKEFFEHILRKKINISKPQLEIHKPLFTLPTEKKYIVIFPGAKDSYRIWRPRNFSKVIDHILVNTSYDVILTGSNNELDLSKKIKEVIGYSPRVHDLTGKTSLTDLVYILSKASLLISNDTAAIHISASVNTPFICISNGQHFGRFHPYPEEIFNKGYYVYPVKIMNRLNEHHYLAERYRFQSELDINEINPAKVIEQLTKYI